MHKTFFRSLTVVTVLAAMWSSMLAQSKGFDTGRMDTSVDACTDFFQYANGTWLKNTEIPSTESRWSSFNILANNNIRLSARYSMRLRKPDRRKAATPSL